jgi:hypothetical protein
MAEEENADRISTPAPSFKRLERKVIIWMRLDEKEREIATP